jgi:hypothetical protein
MAMEARRVEGYGREMNQDAAEYEHRAKRTYSTALGIEADNTMNTLYAQYSDNPVELDKAFKKAYDKVIGEIPDKDVKIGFMADVSLKRQMYLTKAAENKRRNDYRIAKSLTYDGIGKNTETIGTAFSALLGDDFNPDVVAVYGKTMYDTDQMIHLLNDDGTYMFSDEQRKQKQNDIDKAHLIALKGNFNGLQPYQKKQYLDLLAEDGVYIPVSVDENNEVVMKNLQDVVSQESYEKFKDYATRVAKKKNAIMKDGRIIDEDEAWALGEEQDKNSILVENAIKNLNDNGKKGIKKEEPTEYVLRSLEILDSIQNMGEGEGLSKTDYKKYRDQTIDWLMQELKSNSKKDADTYDDALFRESVMSTGLQVLKQDGKIGGGAWSDDMSIVMIRDFYEMAKESGLDLRATDSGSRESAKKLATKAISNTIEKATGGNWAEFNSVFLNGRKVSKASIPTQGVEYKNPTYIIKDGKKVYTETGIEVEQ